MDVYFPETDCLNAAGLQAGSIQGLNRTGEGGGLASPSFPGDDENRRPPGRLGLVPVE